MTTIEGTVERITYRNEDNFYTVFKFKVGTDDIYTCVGNLAHITAGEELRLTGEWVRHNVYGLQFNVEALCPSLRPRWLVSKNTWGRD